MRGAHQMIGILTEDDVQTRIIINVGVKIVSMNQSKSAKILQLSYLKLHKIGGL